jgi:prepilin-type N-terminal cleavage/methylation domain-containing protein
MKLKCSDGFSLIELMVVLMIIACISMLVASSKLFLTDSTMRLELNKLCAVCHYAQRYAMASNQSQTITFNIPTNTYRFREREETLHPGIQFGFINGAKGPPANPTLSLSKPVTFTDGSITFHPDGIMQSGTVYLVNAQKTTMYALSNAVSQVSYLRKYVYDGSWRVINT